jgi:hypothetical protein
VYVENAECYVLGMRPASLEPRLHVLVCTNRRDAGSPLGDGCAKRGEAVYAALKAEVDRRRAHTTVWITRTYCLGICPKNGATVAVHAATPRVGEPRVFLEVEPNDVEALLGAGST